ncbi:MAG: hypothetical protein AAB470_02105 [Patescibacteria group bacterium]
MNPEQKRKVLHMKNAFFGFSVVLVLVMITIASATPASAGDGSGITIRTKSGDVIPASDPSLVRSGSDQVQTTQIKIAPSSVNSGPESGTIRDPNSNWQQSQTQPVSQPSVIVVTQQVVKVVFVEKKKRGFFKRMIGWGGASAYASIEVNSYDGGYYPTYWDYNYSAGERYNYRNTQMLYGGGHRYSGGEYDGGRGGHGSRLIQNHVPPGGLYPYQQGPLVGHRR